MPRKDRIIYILQGAYYEAGTGFLFAFTYLLVGIIYLFDLDLRIYGIFALFVAINTLPFAWVSWQWEQDPLFALIAPKICQQAYQLKKDFPTNGPQKAMQEIEHFLEKNNFSKFSY